MTQNLVESDIKTLIRIGQILKEEREEMGLSHAKISDISRISVMHLKSIEAGDYKSFPKLVFIKGFLKSYARILSTDPTWMLEEYDRIFSEKPEETQINTTLDISPKSSKFSSGGNFNLLAVGFGVLALLFSSISYFLYIYWDKADTDKELLAKNVLTSSVQAKTAETEESAGGSEEKNQTSENESALNSGINAVNSTQASSSSSTLTENNKTSDSETAQEDSKPPSTEDIKANDDAKKPEPSSTAYRLKLFTRQSAWIRLNIDGEREFDIYLDKGKDYSWNAKKYFELTMAQGGLASLTLNDTPVSIAPEDANKLKQLRLPASPN